MKNYLIWYQTSNSSHDVIRGTARNYVRAERMARTLRMHLEAQGVNVLAVGVKSGIHGELYNNSDLHMRWEVNENEE